jgi:hypothetical protein
MRLRRHAGRAAPLLLAPTVLLIAGVSADAGAAPQTPRAADGGLIVVDQDFTVDVDGAFAVTVALPAGFDTATLGADGSDSRLVVDVHEGAETLADVRAALDGDLPQTDDSVDVPLSIGGADPRVVRTSATELTVTVQTESSASTVDALRLPRWGVYPLTVRLVIDGVRVAGVTTFLNRRSVPDSAEDRANDLAVGLVLGTTANAAIGLDGRVDPSRAQLTELSLLADALTAIDDAAAAIDAQPPPRAVTVQPATLAVLTEADPELAARLLPALERGEVLAQPVLPFDPSSAVAAGRGDLFTRLLREGEDALATALPSTRIDRSILLSSRPISREAVALRRDLGTQLILMPYDQYESLDGNIGAFTDTSQLFTLDAGDGARTPALLIDPTFADILTEKGSDASFSQALSLAAQLVALSQQIEESGGSVSRHGIVLARDDGGVPDPAMLGLVTDLLLRADGVRLVEPSDLASIVDTQIIDGGDLLVTPVARAGPDLRDRFEAIDDLSLAVIGTASMLPSEEPLVSSWTVVLGAVVSTALDDDEATAMMDNLRAEVEVYRNGVLGPEPYTFRITGRSGSIVFELRNITDRPLTVRVRMSSAKLEFEDADQTVEVLPLQEKEVRMPFEALSNGTSSVFLRIFTPAPDPSPETQIVDDIVLTARITTLTGLGQLVTGAALLMLFTWWIRHWRQARRRRLADAVTPRHPAAATTRVAMPEPAANGSAVTVAATGVAEPADSDVLAPDAAASTLPPS